MNWSDLTAKDIANVIAGLKNINDNSAIEYTLKKLQKIKETENKIFHPYRMWFNNNEVDDELLPLIKELNNAGLKTIHSCCGHGRKPAYISISLDNVEDINISSGVDKEKRFVLWWKFKNEK